MDEIIIEKGIPIPGSPEDIASQQDQAQEHQQDQPQNTGPDRTKGPLWQASLAAARQGASRVSVQRTAAQRTEDDVSGHEAPQMARQESRDMPRDSGAFSPEYDGPGERMSRLDRDVNQFELPAKLRRKLHNAGWDACYKVVKVMLADVRDVDGTELRAAFSSGWRPAKAKDFPELCMPDTGPNDSIDNNGQRLFIRPLHLTHKAQEEDRKYADAQLQSRMVASQEGRSVIGNEESLADMGRIVRPVAIKLEMEGETGTYGGR
jgi:hypothetical protein